VPSSVSSCVTPTSVPAFRSSSAQARHSSDRRKLVHSSFTPRRLRVVRRKRCRENPALGHKSASGCAENRFTVPPRKFHDSEGGAETPSCT
jgi:hypothetical protein